MTSTTHVYRDSGVDAELDHKSHKVTEKLSECINTIANEPSVAFYRIQEHVRKTLPQLVEQKHEVEEVQQLVQGACFDTEYAGNAVKGMQKSVVHFQNIQELLKNAMFMKQQIDYEDSRKRQGRAVGGNGRPEGPGGSGSKTEEGSDNNMDDSAVSTDSSLAASGHNNTEEQSEACAAKTGGVPTTESGDTRQAEDAAEGQDAQERTRTTEAEDTQEKTDSTKSEDKPPEEDETETPHVPDTEEEKDQQEEEDTGGDGEQEEEITEQERDKRGRENRTEQEEQKEEKKNRTENITEH
ncbi:uncharacterized protein LOC143297151 isoform X2 [Babylonia areolata]